jgi:hypothetical protein
MTRATEAELNLRIMAGLDVFILICVGVDTIWHRRLHPAFAWGRFAVRWRISRLRSTSRKRECGLRLPNR